MLLDDDVPRLTSATPPAQITIPSIEIESSRSSKRMKAKKAVTTGTR
jgi:hypothetical protein